MEIFGSNESKPQKKLVGKIYNKIKRRRIYRFIRVQKPVTKLFRPEYTRSRKYIEIDITYRCNLKCINCNRSCRQAPTNEQMTVEQIQKFIKESIDNNVNWERIRVMGGEPTLHPNVIEILNLLLEYKKKYSPDTCIELDTNGFGKIVNDVLSKVPKEIEIENTSKKSELQLFYLFNMAPKDSIRYNYADYSSGCQVISVDGFGLTPYGYYPCAAAGGIDRIFGFDIGRKKLPSYEDSMTDQLQTFCKLCGRFHAGKRTNSELMSPTWKIAYENYKKRKPKLSLY
jgi:hypothetical protein